MGLKVLAYSCIVISAVLFLETSCQEFVIPVEGEELMYTPSEVFPRQISVLNSTAQVGVVLDSDGERVAILNGETGLGVIIDKNLGMGFEIQDGGWLLYQSSLQDYLKDCNISDLVERNGENVFQLEDQTANSDATIMVQRNIEQLSPDFLREILRDAGDLFKGVLKYFGFILYPLKEVLGPILNLASPVWMVFKGGFLALLNIFKYMGKLISSIVGGLPMLLKMGILFPLNAIIKALDGAKAFFEMLKCLAAKFDLIKILKFLMKSPEKIVQFIVGLGGLMLKGVTGVFGILARLFTFSIYSVASAVKRITETILNYLRGPRPTYENVQSSVDELLTIPEEQQQTYGNGEEFDQYRDFMGAVKGEGNYEVHGIKVAPLVKAVMQTTSSAKAIIMSTLNVLNPLIPFKESLPQLLVNTVKSLNSTKGPSYVEQLLPSVQIPKGGVNDVADILKSSASGDSLEDLRDLPAPELLKKLPVVGQIYNEFDQAAQTYHNQSLDSLLQNHHAQELMEFTTKAIGLVQ